MSDNENSGWKKLLGAAQVVVGGALVLQGLKRVAGSTPAPLFGRGMGYAQPALTEGGSIRTAVAAEIPGNDLDSRIEKINDVFQRSEPDPQVKEDLAWILTGKCGQSWCVPPKNQMAEIQAIFTAVTDPRSPLAVRYTSDHVIYDQFQSYRATRRLKIGDCDDQVIYAGELLTMAGFPIKFRVVQTKNSQTPNHIYLVVGVPKEAPHKWLPFDPTEPQNKLGWQVAGAEQAALSGRAAGEVTKVWDYDVLGLGI